MASDRGTCGDCQRRLGRRMSRGGYLCDVCRPRVPVPDPARTAEGLQVGARLRAVSAAVAGALALGLTLDDVREAVAAGERQHALTT